MNGVCTCVYSSLHDAFNHQVALVGRGGPDTNRFVGGMDKRRMGVGLAVDGHGCQSHVAGRAHHAQRNFSSVGHQNFGDGTDLLAHGSTDSQRM